MALWLPVAAYTGRERVRWGPGSPCDHTLRCSASCALPHATAPAPRSLPGVPISQLEKSESV